MTDESTCPHCGKPVPASAPGGICPECMLKAGLAAQTDAPGDEGPHGTKVVHPPPSPAEIAALFPQLEILECLGRGGMGVVYKARQPRLNRFVALKILAREKEQDPHFTERFTREAQALARLNHPNIVTVHDFGEVAGHCYLVMEFVDGLNLRQLLQTRKMPSEQALTIVPKICEALQYAHEQGIVHRDIKPENILLDKSGRVKIADFGIAKMLGEETGQQTLTGAKDAVGTPHYMAPEQIEKPLSVDHRADIYSLGVVFYEMLTGELPLGKFQPPSQKVQIDVRLDEVVLHALEKEPARRYQQASQIKTAVETISTTTPDKSAITADKIEAVRGELKIPARGLMCAGVLLLLFSAGLLIFALPAIAHEGGDPAGYAAVIFGATVFVIFAEIVLSGAAKMMKLRNYPFCVVASIVAAFAGPGALLGMPFGVWAVVILSRRETREAFEANQRAGDKTALPGGENQRRLLPSGTSPLRRGALTGFIVFLVIVVLAIGVTAILPRTYVGIALVRMPGPPTAQDPYHIQTESEVIQSQTVLEPVAISLNLDQRWGQKFSGGKVLSDDEVVAMMKRMLAVQPVRGSSVAEIRFYSDSPKEAAEIANKIAETYCSRPPGHTGEIIDRATPPWHPTRPDVPLNILIGVVAGSVIGILTGMVTGLFSFWRTRKGSSPPVQKHDHFWRWFAVTVLALIILIPVAFAILFIGLPIAAQFAVDRHAQKQLPVTELVRSDYVGQTWFPRGDSIEITSVERTPNQMTVKGRYSLVSHDSALLALYTTTELSRSRGDEAQTDKAENSQRLLTSSPANDRNEMHISTGRGVFELTHPQVAPGLPHVSMYGADGRPFASLYFGTRTEALEESKASWITNARSNLGPLILRVTIETNAAAVLGETRDGGEVVLTVGNKGLSWSSKLKANTVFGAVVSPLPDELCFNISSGTGPRSSTIQNHIALAPAGRIPRGRWVFHEGTYDGSPVESIVIADLLTEAGESLPVSISIRNPEGSSPQASSSTVEPADLHEARAKLAELRAANLPTAHADAGKTLQFRLVLPEGSTAPADLLPSGSGPYPLRISREVLLDNTVIARAGLDFDPDGGRRIEIRFTDAGAKQFEAITATNIGHQLAIVFRNQVLSAPVIQTVIPNGECQVDGPMSADEISGIVDCLNHVTTPSATAWNFSSVQERILPARILPSAAYGGLDLDSGTVSTNSTLDWESPSGSEWIRSNGIDAVTTESAKTFPTLLGFDMIVAPAPVDGWDIITPADVANNWALLQNEPRPKQVFGAMPGRRDTFVFQTREGGKGIMQVLGLADNPRGVKIRYKLVSRATGTAASQNAESTNPVYFVAAAAGTAPLSYQWYRRNTNSPATGRRMHFGPVIERVIDSSSGPPYDEYSYLDLDTGNLLCLGQAKPAVDPFNVEQFFDWRQKSGADVVAQIVHDPTTVPARLRSDFRGLAGLNTLLVPVDKTAWTNMSPQALVAVVAPVKPDTTRWTMGTSLTNGLPATHLFKTSEGGMGLLQITGFTDNPRSVKIRYKLVIDR